VVLDTNAVLDLLVFQDPSAATLMHALHERELCWVTTPHFLEELRRVLGYPAMRARAPRDCDVAAWADERMDAAIRIAGRFEGTLRACPVRCLDTDDQPFLDLAFTLACPLVSKDKRVRQAARKARIVCVATGDELLALHRESERGVAGPTRVDAAHASR
jgi:uncharacterized protein